MADFVKKWPQPIRNGNHVLKVWQQVHPEGRKNRGLLSLMHPHQWHLSEDQHGKFMTYLANYPVLQAL